MSESLEQRALRIWLNCNGETNHSNKSKITEFARRLTEQGEPVVEIVGWSMSPDNPTVRWNGTPPAMGSKLYASPPSDALDAKRYRARRAEIYKLRLRTEIPRDRNWKPTTVEEFNAEYDAECDRQIREQAAAMGEKP